MDAQNHGNGTQSRRLFMLLMRNLALGLFFLLMTGSWVRAAGDTPSNKSPGKGPAAEASKTRLLTLDALKKKRAEIEASKELNDSAKKSALAYMDEAIRFRDELNQIEERSRAFVARIKAAPDRISKIENRLKKQGNLKTLAESIKKGPTKDVDRLADRLRQENAALVEARARLNTWEQQIEKETGRPQQIREEMTRTKQRLNELNDQLGEKPPPHEHPQITEARRLSLLTEKDRCRALIKADEQRLAGADVFQTLILKEKELAVCEVKKREILTRALQAKIQNSRELAAMKTKTRVETAAAEMEATRLPAPVQEQFDFNIRLAGELQDIIRDQRGIKEEAEKKKEQRQSLEKAFARARVRVKTAISGEALGMSLRQQRQALPTFLAYRQESARRRLKMAGIQAREVEISRLKAGLSDLDAEVERIIRSAGTLSPALIKTLRPRLKNLLKERLGLVRSLDKEYHRYFKELETVEFEDQQLVTLSQKFREFLDLKLMWIRSSRIIGPEDLGNVPRALIWLTDPANWKRVFLDLWDSVKENPVSWFLGLLVSLSLLVTRGRMKRDLAGTARKVGDVRKDSFLLTLRALSMTAGLAAGWPALLFLLARQLSLLPAPHEFTVGVSNGLYAMASTLALYGFFYYLCCDNGLGHVHFQWSESARLTLRQNILWLIWTILPLTLIFFIGKHSMAYSDSMGRLAFMSATVAVSVCTGRILRFSGGVVTALRAQSPNGLLMRTWFIWYPLATGLPLCMGFLAAIGFFFYTSLRLANRIMATYELVLVLVVINHLIQRWLLIAKRRFQYQERLREHEKEHEEGTDRKDEAPPPADGKRRERGISITQIDEQTRALRPFMIFASIIGFWIIWAQVLPALGSVLDITLWTYSAEVDGITKSFPITLYSLIVAVVIAAITMTVSRNLPGLLEIIFLSRLNLDRGSRYAIATISRYTIAAVGLIIASNTIGFRWSQLQWLVAALGVGIGFGLQEIVANFISGIIILFEQPVRVGDVVTVDNTTGIVSRIRMRATTITDWDKKEYVVPNKEFVTGRLLNWTLSSPINRIVIEVGVAHGSNTRLARELLLRAAHDHPRIMEDPAPLATFEGFEDNAYKFVLRCFLPTMDTRLDTINELHMNIEKSFREAGITISLPRRDVQLDARRPLDIRLITGEAPEENASAGRKSSEDVQPET